MYAWARDAPPTILPDDVAFKLEPNDFIVLQIHYANQFEEPDHTSVTLKVSSQKPKYFAGIYILWKGFFRWVLSMYTLHINFFKFENLTIVVKRILNI